MFGKNHMVTFGTMYPNQKIALVTDTKTGAKAMYKVCEITRKDKLFYNNLKTFMLEGKEYVATEMSTSVSLPK